MISGLVSATLIHWGLSPSNPVRPRNCEPHGSLSLDHIWEIRTRCLRVFLRFGFNGERTPGAITFAEEPCKSRCRMLRVCFPSTPVVLHCYVITIKGCVGFVWSIALYMTLVFAWCME